MHWRSCSGTSCGDSASVGGPALRTRCTFFAVRGPQLHRRGQRGGAGESTPSPGLAESCRSGEETQSADFLRAKGGKKGALGQDGGRIWDTCSDPAPSPAPSYLPFLRPPAIFPARAGLALVLEVLQLSFPSRYTNPPGAPSPGNSRFLFRTVVSFCKEPWSTCDQRGGKNKSDSSLSKTVM